MAAQPPPVPIHTRPISPATAKLRNSMSALRSLLVRLPNASVSRLNPSTEQWDHLDSGDLSVYQVNQAPASPGNRSPARTVSPPAVPAKPAGLSNGIPASTSAPSSPVVAPLPTAPRPGTGGIVLHVGGTEFPISSTTSVRYEEPNSYILDNGSGYIVRCDLQMPRVPTQDVLDNAIRRHSQRGDSFPGTPASSGSTTPDLLASDFKGQLLLMDETSGKILGPLTGAMPMQEGQGVGAENVPGQTTSDQAVVISLPSDDDPAGAGGAAQVSAFDDFTRDFGKSDSKLINAAEYVSKGLLFAAEYGANTVSSAAANYTKTTKATETPLVFSDTTKASVAKLNSATGTAAKYSRATLGFIASKAEQVGGAAVRLGQKELQEMGIVDPNAPKKPGMVGNAASGIKGVFKNALAAGLLIAEGAEKGGKHFLETGRQSTNTVVGHKYGEEAKLLTNEITSAGQNVALVYVDARGVAHRALLARVGKGVGKGALKARMKDGREVILDDSGLAGQHTERDAEGNLVVVDEKNQQAITIADNASSTALETTAQQNRNTLIQRPAKAAPPVPPRPV